MHKKLKKIWKRTRIPIKREGEGMGRDRTGGGCDEKMKLIILISGMLTREKKNIKYLNVIINL